VAGTWAQPIRGWPSATLGSHTAGNGRSARTRPVQRSRLATLRAFHGGSHGAWGIRRTLPPDQVFNELTTQGIAAQGGIPEYPAEDVLRVPAMPVARRCLPSKGLPAMHPAAARRAHAPVPAGRASPGLGFAAAFRWYIG